MTHPLKERTAYFWIVLIITFSGLTQLSLAQTCTGGLGVTNAQDCTGTPASPCHSCDVTDMDFEIRAPDDTTTTGWQNMSYSTQTGTCSTSCTEETWTSNYGYTFCPQEGAYDARTRAYTNSAWETSAWQTSVYSVNWDSSQNWCTCKTGSSANWFSSVSGGSNGNCCGDDGASDDFYYSSASPTTATSLQCSRCYNGSKSGPSTLYGNGYWSGSSLTTDTSGTCYYGDIICTASQMSNGESSTFYGNGYTPDSPSADTSGTCYYGDIACSDGSASNGASITLYGNGYHPGSITTDLITTCYYTDWSCGDGTYSHGTIDYLYGNGYWSGSSPATDTSGTCYYGDPSCGDGVHTDGASGTYYGNGYTSYDPATDVSGSCYYGDITCTDGSASNGSVVDLYGNGYYGSQSPTTDTSGTCYYGDWSCSDGSYSHGAAATVFGNGYTPDSPTTSTTGTCYYGDWSCGDGTYSNGSTTSLKGNGYYSGSLTTDTALTCYYGNWYCGNGSYSNGSIDILHGNGYWSGSSPATDTSGTCYYGNMSCGDGVHTDGASGTYYGNGYWSGTDTTTDTSGTCYYGDITCSDGSASNGASGTYVGNGYTTDSPTTDLSGLCYYGNITCSDGSASNGASATVYGNGYDSGTTCYYGDWTCVDGTASNGNSCTLACSGVGTTCCPTQNTFRDTITCSESGCGYADHDRDDSQAYCTSTSGGCTAYTWDSLGARCCGDDGSGDTFCTAGGGSCISGSWNADHCSDGVKNCDEVGIDSGGSDCSLLASDTTPPITSHDGNEQWQSTSQTITLTCSDGTAVGATGCAHTYYCIDDSNTCLPNVEGTTIDITCSSNDVNKKFVRFYSVDYNNNVEQVNGVYIRIDKQNPVTSTSAQAQWLDSNVSVTLSCSDGNGSGCLSTSYRVDSNPSKAISLGAWQAYSSPVTFSSDGNYAIEYYSTDNLNHTETTKSALILIDKGFVSLGFESTSATYADYNGVVIVPISTDGNHRIDYNSTDMAGNTEQVRTGWAALDKNPPSTTDDLNTEWQNSDFSINLSCSDSGSGCTLTQYRLDSNSSSGVSTGSWQAYSAPIAITTDGNWALDYNSSDLVGWREATHRIYALLDKTKPTVTDNAPADWQNSNVLVTLTASDATSGIANTYYCVDSVNACTPFVSGTSVNVTCPSNAICRKYIRYYSIDRAGNKSDTNSALVRIDKEYPITTDDANTQCQGADQNVTLSPTDGAGSGIADTVSCVDDANTCTPDTNGTTVSVTCASGSVCRKYLRYHSTDNAGNLEDIRSVLITIDKEAPTTSDDANIQWQGSNQNITLTPSDGSGCGVTATHYCVDTDNSCTPSTSGTSVSITCTAGSVCRKYLRYYSRDVAGNTETTKSVLIRIDMEAPTTTSDANTEWVNTNQTVNFTINDSSGAGGDSAYYCIDDTNSCNPNTYSTSAVVTCDVNSVCQKYLRFKGVDYVGNQDQTRSVLIRIDKNAPFTSSDANTEWVNADQQVTLSPHDTGSGLVATYYCVDSDNSCSPSTQGTSISISCPTGSVCQQYLRYYSTDAAGNNESVHSDLVRIDKNGPYTVDNAPAAWQSTDVNVTLSPSDDSGVAATYYCVDTTATCTPSTSGTIVSVTCDVNSVCQKYVRYYSVDNGGNTEATKTSNPIRIDKNGPYTVDNAPAAWQSSDVNVTLSPTDALGSGVSNTYYCKDYDGTPDCTPSSSGTSVSVTAAVDSITLAYIRYYSVDSVGNQESIKQTLVRIDREKPTTTDNASSDWTASDVNVTLSPSDGSGSGIADTYYCIDDSNSCSPSSSGTIATVTCDVNSICQKYVRYYSVDSVGNQEDTKSSVVIRIDKNGPYTSNNISKEWYGDDVNVELTCSSSTNSCAETTYRINGGSWIVYSSPFTVSATGINTIDYNSRDSIGNVESIRTAYVRIDRTAPSTTNDANTFWQNTDMQFNLLPSDSQSGVAATYYCIDTSDSCTPTTSGTTVNVTCEANQNCNKYVRYYSVDNVNNTESPKSVLVRIDKRYPFTLAEAPSGCVNIDFNVALTCVDEGGSGRHIIKYRFDSEQWLSSPQLTQLEELSWWDLNWARRRKILFDNSGQSAKINASVLLRLNSGNFHFLEVQEDGRDLRFIDSDGHTQLQYFIDTFSRSQQDAVVWVKVPQIDADSSTDYVWMYYSNSNADANQVANWFG